MKSLQRFINDDKKIENDDNKTFERRAAHPRSLRSKIQCLREKARD